jgi:hypothetical protein
MVLLMLLALPLLLATPVEATFLLSVFSSSWSCPSVVFRASSDRLLISFFFILTPKISILYYEETGF